jgi:hypothetical protein
VHRPADASEPWSDNERHLLALVLDGRTVVVNVRTARGAPHRHLVPHLVEANLLVYVGRRSRAGWPQSLWGNPFPLRREDDREAMIAEYRRWLHQPGQTRLLATVGGLTGKALGCWCAPKACHADVLRVLADPPGVT